MKRSKSSEALAKEEGAQVAEDDFKVRQTEVSAILLKMRFLVHAILMGACMCFAGCGRSDSDDEALRHAELAKMREAIELSIHSSKSCELISKNSPYLEPVVMLTRDFTLMLEHRDSLMKDAWVGDYRFMVQWQKGERLRRKLAIADYNLWLLKEEIEVLEHHLAEAKRHARFDPNARSVLFQMSEESKRLQEAIQYAEDVLRDPHMAQSSEFYDPRFVQSFLRITDRLSELMAE